MTITNLPRQKQDIKDVPDHELDERWTSIMHSIVQGQASISFWHEELDAIRKERNRRKAVEVIQPLPPNTDLLEPEYVAWPTKGEKP